MALVVHTDFLASDFVVADRDFAGMDCMDSAVTMAADTVAAEDTLLWGDNYYDTDNSYHNTWAHNFLEAMRRLIKGQFFSLCRALKIYFENKTITPLCQ